MSHSSPRNILQSLDSQLDDLRSNISPSKQKTVGVKRSAKWLSGSQLEKKKKAIDNKIIRHMQNAETLMENILDDDLKSCLVTRNISMDQVEHNLQMIKDKIQSLKEKVPYQRPPCFYKLADVSHCTLQFSVPAYNEVDRLPFADNVEWIERSVAQRDVSERLTNATSIENLVGCRCVYCFIEQENCVCISENIDHMCCYDEEGTLKAEIGCPIYECNPACFCPDDCKNRVVQKGPTYPVELFKTKDKGWGVRAQVDIPKGKFICEYIGEIITNSEAERRGLYYDATNCSYLYDLDMDPDEKGEELCIDAYAYGNISRYINHSCDPNLQNYQVWFDHLDKGMPHVAFFSNRDIHAGEELSFDYKYERIKRKGKKNTIKCSCGAANCRKILT